MKKMLLRISLFIFIAIGTESLYAQLNIVPINTATHTAVQSGSWFAPSTWDVNTVPGNAAIVYVPNGISVSYIGESDAHIFAVRIDGEFNCSQPNANDTTKLKFDTFIGAISSVVKLDASGVSDGFIDIEILPFDIESHKAGTSGYVQVWNANAINYYSDGVLTYEVEYNAFAVPLSATSIDDNSGMLGRHQWDPKQLGLGFVTHGELEILGKEKAVMAKLTTDASAGDDYVIVDRLISGWEIGDSIMVSVSGTGGSANNEAHMIESIVSDTIYFTGTLASDHFGVSEYDLHCYVGNLDRNIRFYSGDHSMPSTRGHMMAMHNPTNVQIRNAKFLNMGRTDKSRHTDDMVFDYNLPGNQHGPLCEACATLRKPAADSIINPRGRYSIHLHRTGAVNGTNMTHVTGNVVQGSIGWGITHHDSNAEVSRNFVYDVRGAGIVSEAGSETGFWKNNLVMKIATGNGGAGGPEMVHFGNYLYNGQGLGMLGRAVVCDSNVIISAFIGVGISNFNGAITPLVFMDPLALSNGFRGFTVDQFPLSRNEYDGRSGIIPLESALIIDNTEILRCSSGMNSLERENNVNHESRSIIRDMKIWGSGRAIRINYQADYSYKDLLIYGNGTNAKGLQMYKHAVNHSFENLTAVNLKYLIRTEQVQGGTIGRTNGISPWNFINLKMENVRAIYFQDNANTIGEHTENIHYWKPEDVTTTRELTFTPNNNMDLEVNVGTGDFEFIVDGVITDALGVFEFGVERNVAQHRSAYHTRKYEFASQQKFEEYLDSNGVYIDTTTNELYFIITEYVQDRLTFEFKGFPMRIKIVDAPTNGVYASPLIEPVEIFLTGNQLISRFASATQSSTSTTESFNSVQIDPYAMKALDRNSNGLPTAYYFKNGLLPLSSSAITNVELEPWWDMDLGDTMIIEHIDIFNTLDLQGIDIETPSPHFKNFYVLISDTAFDASMTLAQAQALADHQYYQGNEVKRFFRKNDLNAYGRYIRIQAEGVTKIGISEVDVIGRERTEEPDCNGVINGLAYNDQCGTCVMGNTGATPCELDCNDDWGGTSFIDTCGICTEEPEIKFETNSLSNVSNNWQTVNLGKSYTSPVIIATPVLSSSSDKQIVTRIRNVNATSFEIRVQNPKDEAVSGYSVQYMVIDEGVYTVGNDGVKMEAKKVTSTNVSGRSNWGNVEQQTYSNSYTNPVVLGQVMSSNDASWSAFWASGASRGTVPSSTMFNTGKHVGEDTDLSRSNETIGYIVFEEGNGDINDISFFAGVGSDIVKGTGNTSVGYNYSISGFQDIDNAILSSAGQDGGDGSWPVLYGANPIQSDKIVVAVDEDNFQSERGHTTEQVAYAVFDVPGRGQLVPIGDDLDQEMESNENKIQKFNVKLYPNPISQGDLNIELTGFDKVEYMNVTIYDMLGRECLQIENSLERNKLQLKINGFTPGMYIVKISTDIQTVNKSFIIK